MADLRQQFTEDADSGPKWWRRAIAARYLSRHSRSTQDCDIHYLHYPPTTLALTEPPAGPSAESADGVDGADALESAAAAAIAAGSPSVVFLHGTAAHAQWYQ